MNQLYFRNIDATYWGAVTLCGCGAVDSNVTYLPEALRQRAAKMEIEQPPTSI